jgi:hypothetical protein
MKISFGDFLVGITKTKAIISVDSKKKKKIRLFDKPKRETRNLLIVSDEVEI